MMKDNQKADRRTSRTRRQLRNALMALMLEDGYNSITVEDITNRADLGRTTFYLHYRDKEELLIESLESIAEDLKEQVELEAGFAGQAGHSELQVEHEVGQSGPVELPSQPVEQEADNNHHQEGGAQARWNPVAVVFRHVDENRDFYRVILKGEGSSKVLSRIRDIIEEAATEFFFRHMSGFVSEPPEIPKGIMAGYFASSMLGFITLLLEKELPYRGDEAADLFMILFFRGASSVLNLTLQI